MINCKWLDPQMNTNEKHKWTWIKSDKHRLLRIYSLDHENINLCSRSASVRLSALVDGMRLRLLRSLRSLAMTRQR